MWRKKAQFDEGSGTVDALQRALRSMLGGEGPVSRDDEAALYARLLDERFEEPEMIRRNAGEWVSDRVVA